MLRLALRSAYLTGLCVVAGVVAGPLAAGAQYRQPPQPIAQILDQPATPLVQLSPDRERLLLLERPGLPPIADVAAFEYRLAGLRFDPRNSGPSRGQAFTGLSLQPVPGGPATRIRAALPAGAAITNVSWSADGATIAFSVATDDAITLWVADVATAEARQVTPRPLNAVLGAPCTWVAVRRLA
jgi:dipeptidyl aminopeptidase/acylaminoacyl peptidase